VEAATYQPEPTGMAPMRNVSEAAAVPVMTKAAKAVVCKIFQDFIFFLPLQDFN
jgi:hypothetical protein